jgi:hypothetical protein
VWRNVLEFPDLQGRVGRRVVDKRTRRGFVDVVKDIRRRI